MPDSGPEGYSDARVSPPSNLCQQLDDLWQQGQTPDVWQFLDATGDAAGDELVALLRLDQQQRWRRGQRVLVESYLAGRPQLASDEEMLLDLLYSEVLLRDERGESPRLEEYQQRFPQYQDRLRRQFEVHEALADESLDDTGISSATRGFSGPDPATDSQPAASAQPSIPGYEVLDEVGRGGMGIVYKARQLMPERIVALKLIRRDWLDFLPDVSKSSAIDRFHTEAEAAAQLEHDNIVTVYEVGDIQGQHYYAMRYVDGQSLAEIHRDTPSENREAAGCIERVARAVHQAHSQGILHRDIKPQNIMVDRRTNRPLVTDFGLAKFLSARDDRTRTGEAIGTPAYMSPEQARDAAHVTQQADVYSLGATLYYVLTSRPPFQAANLIETLRQITSEDPVSPRQLNPAVDRDLDTICLKCLDKETTKRYASAELLADDLQRYCQGKPILARPIGFPGRTWRWCRRNPAVAGWIGVAAVFLTVAVLALVIGIYRTSAALSKSDKSLAKADESLTHALKVVDEWFTRISEDELLNQPGLQPLRRDLLDRALTHYQWFLDHNSDDPTIRDELAAAHYRVGLITGEIGSREDALTSFERARRMQQESLSESVHDAGRLKALGDTLNAMGNLLTKVGRLDEAREEYLGAVEVRESLAGVRSDDVEPQRLLANTVMHVGLIEMNRGYPDEARRLLEESQSIRSSVIDDYPRDAKLQRDLASGYFNLATLGLAVEDNQQAAADFKRAIAGFEKLLDAEPGVLLHQYRLALCRRLLGDLEPDLDRAMALYDQALPQMEILAQANPEVSKYNEELASLHMNRGDIQQAQQDFQAAQRSLDQALELIRAMIDRNPEVHQYKRDLAVTLCAKGKAETRLGDYENARANLEEARQLLLELGRQFPDDPDIKDRMVDAEEALGELEAEVSPE